MLGNKSQRGTRGKHGQTKYETSHFPLLVFLVSKHSLLGFWGCLVSHLWIGEARHPCPKNGSIGVGAWGGFLGVLEHRLVPARVRSERSRLRLRDVGSVWAPASLDSSHVGHADVGVVRLKGAPLSLPSIATAGFRT